MNPRKESNDGKRFVEHKAIPGHKAFNIRKLEVPRNIQPDDASQQCHCTIGPWHTHPMLQPVCPHYCQHQCCCPIAEKLTLCPSLCCHTARCHNHCCQRNLPNRIKICTFCKDPYSRNLYEVNSDHFNAVAHTKCACTPKDRFKTVRSKPKRYSSVDSMCKKDVQLEENLKLFAMNGSEESFERIKRKSQCPSGKSTTKQHNQKCQNSKKKDDADADPHSPKCSGAKQNSKCHKIYKTLSRRSEFKNVLSNRTTSEDSSRTSTFGNNTNRSTNRDQTEERCKTKNSSTSISKLRRKLALHLVDKKVEEPLNMGANDDTKKSCKHQKRHTKCQLEKSAPTVDKKKTKTTNQWEEHHITTNSVKEDAINETSKKSIVREKVQPKENATLDVDRKAQELLNPLRLRVQRIFINNLKSDIELGRTFEELSSQINDIIPKKN